MKVLLCEGTRDMEFLLNLLTKLGFQRARVKYNYLWEKLGLNYKKFTVLRNENEEIFIFYPLGGGSKSVIGTIKAESQIINWCERGVSKIGLAIDLDDKAVQGLLSSIEHVLKSKYEVVKEGNFSFKCRCKGCELDVIVIPLGDTRIEEKLGFNVLQHEIEDLILDLALSNENFKHIIGQAIDFYKEKKGKEPTQKAIVKILESLCKDPDYGTFELISEIFSWSSINELPDYVVESIREFIQ
ncbi:DUF3226 domain-containing protein [Pyrococcus kukulkanii]|uniref:DUF3226 domain-containing protein n=1 Tax=Pyrococcus kukulkanii TaxID=1609559 RepID=A0ABV4T5B4_9EURY